MKEKTALINELLEHSVTSSSDVLSMMLKKKVVVEASKSFYAPLWEIADYFEPSDEVYTAVAMKFTQSLKGVMLMVLKEDSAVRLARSLVGNFDDTALDELSELKISALKETANIIFGALLTKISQVSNLRLLTSIPDISTDMLRASLDELCGDIAIESRHALAFSTTFAISPLEVEGRMILIIDDDSIGKVLREVK